ncbi:MAG: hypothetical protein MUD14_27495 [Hydrococcus sp. Prado102]|jgi:hypothetical protein|nr:hypothetical protein [Hydrococcus sp. Prado102]
MYKPNQGKNKKNGLLTIIFSGLLIGLPTIPLIAQTLPIGAKPCARIFYEEPYNGYVIVPDECPPNAATQRAREAGQMRDRSSETSTVPTPSASEADDRVATVTPTNGTVDVQLKNNTNAVVRYQAIGYSDYLPLEGGEETVLRNIPLPATITFARQDDGFVEIKPVTATSAEGMLMVDLDEDREPLDSNQGTLRIQEDGTVLLN